MRRRRRQLGVVLALVLVLALLLSVSIVGFARRALIDTMIVNNRDAGARAAALARGGLRLATALLIEDQLAKNLNFIGAQDIRFATLGNTEDDLWNQMREFELVGPGGGRLRIEIYDAGSLLNLNAVVRYTAQAAPPDPDAEEFLKEFFEKVIDEMPIDPGEKLYDPVELARNLIDYIDVDRIRLFGGHEDDYYQAQDPPYRAANRPLLSVEELGLVEGFDVQLAESLRPYVTVYPVVDGTGINLNMAPPHVLALIYTGVSGQRRLVTENQVSRILKVREEGRVVCTAASRFHDCVTMSEVDLDEGSVFPKVVLPDESYTFTVKAHARVGEIERTLIAVIDREELTEPKLLFWRME